MMMLAICALTVAATELRSVAVDANGALEPVPDDTLRYSIARFQSMVVERDVLRPWQGTGQQAMFVGSGFLLRWDEDGPLVCTNAHVINDAAAVVMQVPSIGEEQFPAKVVLVNHDMDIALVRLQDEDTLEAFQAKISKDQFRPVKLHEGAVKVGQEVRAMGFPLGVNSLKVTSGIISGHQSLSGFLSYQNTAQISPGNSGGPLFIAGSNEVVGINYASLEGQGSEQNNFAVPAFRVHQMMLAYDAEGPEEPVYGQYKKAACTESREMCTLKIPPLATEMLPGTKAMYAHYGCEAGAFASKVQDHSLLATADPPVASKSFITKVNGVKLDSFGQGVDTKFTSDPVDWFDLAFMSEEPLKEATIETCSCGKTQTHTLNLQYQKANEAPVPYIDEPMFATLDFEQFGDVTIAPMTMNAAKALMGAGMLQMVSYIADPEGSPARLLITDVAGGGEASQSVSTGSVISKVNGVKAKTMKELRENFAPQSDVTCAAQERAELMKAGGEDDGANPLFQLLTSNATNGWSLTTTDGSELVEDYRLTLVMQAHKISSGEAPLTNGVQLALQGMAGELKALEPAEAEETESAILPAEDAEAEDAGVGKIEKDGKEEPETEEEKAKVKAVSPAVAAGVQAAQKAAMPSKPFGEPSKAATLKAFAAFKGSAVPIEARTTARRGGVMASPF